MQSPAFQENTIIPSYEFKAFLYKWEIVTKTEIWVSNVILSFCRLSSLCAAAHRAYCMLQGPAKEHGCSAQVMSRSINGEAGLLGEVSPLGSEGGMLPGATSSQWWDS